MSGSSHDEGAVPEDDNDGTASSTQPAVAAALDDADLMVAPVPMRVLEEDGSFEVRGAWAVGSYVMQVEGDSIALPLAVRYDDLDDFRAGRDVEAVVLTPLSMHSGELFVASAVEDWPGAVEAFNAIRPPELVQVYNRAGGVETCAVVRRELMDGIGLVLVLVHEEAYEGYRRGEPCYIEVALEFGELNMLVDEDQRQRALAAIHMRDGRSVMLFDDEDGEQTCYVIHHVFQMYAHTGGANITAVLPVDDAFFDMPPERYTFFIGHEESVAGRLPAHLREQALVAIGARRQQRDDDNN